MASCQLLILQESSNYTLMRKYTWLSPKVPKFDLVLSGANDLNQVLNYLLYNLAVP
jgi:hypothetical protein